MTNRALPSTTPQPIARLIQELNKLPGVGPKTAQRLAYHLLRIPVQEARALAEAILAVKEQVVWCSLCQNLADQNPCALCTDPKRDTALLCVVEQPLDVLALERTGVYKGLYHVLHGALSPLEGIGPEDLKIRELVERVKTAPIQEVILATNPTLEGEATAMYLHRLLAPLGLRITRLARGLPAGAEVEYADALTLQRAFEGRHAMG
ncbi:MAG: recombination mediator RecR [Dehalococcoidia bacterium]|nr:recombination mediator RecR [Dehalococcoidia bacterium]MDW8119410.1 recombination mediator RecR [Chloroflexota bacterium]